jgi:hypothetical protein
VAFAATVLFDGRLLAGVEQVADLREARAAHTITTLSGGEFLVAGGFADGTGRALATTEIFDASTRRFEPGARLAEARFGHTASQLPDGSVLLAGGWGATGSPTSSVERFDPVARVFRPAPLLRDARAGHIAVTLTDGRVLLAGGLGASGQQLTSAEVYDPATDRFSIAGPMAAPRENHAALRLADGQVLVTGGHSGRGRALRHHASAELFDPRKQRFLPVGDLLIARHKHDMVLLADGRVLVAGGSTAESERTTSTEIFDPATARFTHGPALSEARFKHAGTSFRLRDGTVLFLGGASASERVATSPLPNEQSRAIRPPGAESYAAAARAADGTILLAGGYGDGVQVTRRAWLIVEPTQIPVGAKIAPPASHPARSAESGSPRSYLSPAP